MNTDIPKRPAWNHKEVKEAAAAEIVDAVRDWASVSGCLGDDDTDPKQFRALVAIAVLESPDAYQAGRYFEDFYGWPVDRVFINILDTAYNRMPILCTKFVHTWVTKNAVRFPAKKGQGVNVRIGDCEFTAEVQDIVHREARGLVLPLGRGTKPLMVPAEEIIEAFDIKKSTTPPSGGKPPTGGTPVAKKEAV